MEKNREITFAKHDPAMGLMSIVRPVMRGSEPGRLDLRQEQQGWTIRILGPYMLSATNQSVLFALLGLTSVEARMLDVSSEKETHKALRAAMRCEGQAEDEATVYLKTTLYRLSQVVYCGASDKRYRSLKESLVRLSAISIRLYDGVGNLWGGSALISPPVVTGNDVSIALNWKLALAVAGTDSQYVKISIDERRALKSDVGQIIHAWVSAWLRPGRTGRVGIDTLSEKVWGDCSDNPSTRRSRRQRVKKALSEIAVLDGWEVATLDRTATIARMGTHYCPNGDALLL